MIVPAVAPLAASLSKLERRGAFSADARSAFLELKSNRQSLASRRALILEGDEISHCYFLARGYLSRSKLVRNGGRQIVSFHMAGDIVDLGASLLLVADHTIQAHENCVIDSVLATDMLELAESFPEIGRALWFDALVDASVCREWALNLGRRRAAERLAHLLLELGYRAEEAGLGKCDDFALTLTQTDLADALGLTPVHVNRSLSQLREQGLIDVVKGRVTMPSYDRAATFAEFRTVYLHPEGPRKPALQDRPFEPARKHP